MKKSKSKYVCQACGHESPRWMGRCPECEAWNQFVEEISQPVRTTTRSPSVDPVPLDRIDAFEQTRMITGIGEFDRILGGGIVPGSVLLVAGAPGMGKSTLLIQVCHRLADHGKSVLYISGEESLHQIKLRAQRLGIDSSAIHVLTETSLETVLGTIEKIQPSAAVVDSVQTLQSSLLESMPGNVGQVRYCAGALTQMAKKMSIPVLMVGHVTKDGHIAGPRVLEHLVDGMFFLEGDQQHLFRLFRSVKNRFGPTNEVGIFEMAEKGMIQVQNPSEYLIAQRREDASGSVVTVSMEGSRPLLVEIQALVTPTSYGIPQRTATGFDQRRLAMLLAVLEKRMGQRFSTMDVFVNAAGGLRLTEPGVDLAVAVALISSIRDKAVSGKTAVLGEVGLSGEVRAVPHLDLRVQEARRLGFNALIVPAFNRKTRSYQGVRLMPVETLRDIRKLWPGKEH
ncbi:MAG TPA: DNA repair protein RadA [bacterium]|nr:DNA repair protein RadA [bacterium]